MICLKLCCVLMHMNSYLCCFHYQVSSHLNVLHEWVKGYYTNNEMMWLRNFPTETPHHLTESSVWWGESRTTQKISAKVWLILPRQHFFHAIHIQNYEEVSQKVEKYFLWLYFQISTAYLKVKEVRFGPQKSYQLPCAKPVSRHFSQHDKPRTPFISL